MDRPSYCRICLGIFAVIWIALAIVMAVVTPTIVHNAVASMSPPVPSNINSTMWPMWVSPTNNSKYPQTITLSLTVFNITNAMDWHENGATPELQEIGPYIYNMYKWKDDIHWYADEPTNVYYTYHTTYGYNQGATGSTLNSKKDRICVPNLGVLALSTAPWGYNYYAGQPSSPVYSSWSTFSWDQIYTVIGMGTSFAWQAANWSGVDLVKYYNPSVNLDDGWEFKCMTPDELFFQYTDNFTQALTLAIQNMSGSSIPIPIPGTVFQAIQNDWNVTYLNDTIESTDKNTLGAIKDWAGYVNTMPWYNVVNTSVFPNPPSQPPPSNFIQGSDGTHWSPEQLGEGQSIDIFVDLLYRSLKFNYTGTSSIKSIPTQTYAMDYNQMLACPKNPTACYYNNNMFDGFFNLTNQLSFFAGGPAPVFVSKPYFLDATQEWTPLVKMPRAANRALDDSSLQVEPITGNAVQITQRLQMNALYVSAGQGFNDSCMGSVTPLSNSMFPTWTNNVSKTAMIPFIKAEVVCTISDDMASELNTLLTLIKVLRWGGMAVFLTLAIVFSVLAYRCGVFRRATLEREQEKSCLIGKSNPCYDAPPPNKSMTTINHNHTAASGAL